MKIIVDANIFFTNYLIQTSLPTALNSFVEACTKNGHVIVITQTTKLEFDRKQKEAREREMNEIQKAYRTLKKHKIRFNDIDPNLVVREPNLISLLKDNGAKVVNIEPTIIDFNYAHQKACLHLAPHPPESKTDEMRDLIVWSIALQIAKEDDGAMLISNDQLHINPRGDQEAKSVGLVRFDNIENALEYMSIETPNGKIIRQLLDFVWEDLLKNDIPLIEKPSLKGISQVMFTQGKVGPSKVLFSMKAVGPENKEFSSRVEIHLEDNTITEIVMDEIIFDEKAIHPLDLHLKIETNLFSNDYDERLNSLKSTLNKQ